MAITRDIGVLFMLIRLIFAGIEADSETKSSKHYVVRGCEDTQFVTSFFSQIDGEYGSTCNTKSTVYEAPQGYVLSIGCSYLYLRCASSYRPSILAQDVNNYKTRLITKTDDTFTTLGNKLLVDRTIPYPCYSRCEIRTQKRSTPTCNCGLRVSPRIVGGFGAEEFEFPWQVFIHTDRAYGGGYFCAGSVISNSWVLTAASCNPSRRTELWLGTVNPYQSYTAYRTASQVYIYPGFTGTNMNDIALIRLSSPVSYSSRIQPICLTGSGIYNGDTGVVAGWGSTTSGYVTGTPRLRKTTLSIISNFQCSQEVEPTFTVTSSQLCAKGYNSGACKGDSGGALVVQQSGRSYAVGVFSIPAVDCARRPSVFSKLSSFLPWIKRTTGETFCN